MRTWLVLAPVLWLGACAQAPVGEPVAPCTDYCRSFEEGYQWARNGNLSDPRHCRNYPPDFHAGCEQAIRELNAIRPAREGN